MCDICFDEISNELYVEGCSYFQFFKNYLIENGYDEVPKTIELDIAYCHSDNFGTYGNILIEIELDYYLTNSQLAKLEGVVNANS